MEVAHDLRRPLGKTGGTEQAHAGQGPQGVQEPTCERASTDATVGHAPYAAAHEHERGYLRVTPAELDRALKDPEWARDLAEEIQDVQAEGEPAPAEARHFTTQAEVYPQIWDSPASLDGRAGRRAQPRTPMDQKAASQRPAR